MFEWEDGTILERPYVEISGQKYYLEDGTYSGGTPVSSANLNAMQNQNIAFMKNQINLALTWKLAGNATGSSTITLPASFNELLCIITMNANASVVIPINIPKIALSSTDKGFNGGYYEGASVNAHARVTANAGTINLVIAKLNGSDVLNNSSIEVYYR